MPCEHIIALLRKLRGGDEEHDDAEEEMEEVQFSELLYDDKWIKRHIVSRNKIGWVGEDGLLIEPSRPEFPFYEEAKGLVAGTS